MTSALGFASFGGGIGPSRLEKYGTRILRIVKDPL
jgi:hypothetical protein